MIGGFLKTKESCLVVVDVQGKLAELMHDSEKLFKNIEILIKAAKILCIPILWCQQQPKALGGTIPRIANLLGDIEPVNKACFSCWGNEEFRKRIEELGKRNVLLCGIEAHVCIYQTAVDLAAAGKRVEVISDAVSSRTAENKGAALERLRQWGLGVSSVEMVLFEIMKTAEHPKFKEVVELVK